MAPNGRASHKVLRPLRTGAPTDRQTDRQTERRETRLLIGKNVANYCTDVEVSFPAIFSSLTEPSTIIIRIGLLGGQNDIHRAGHLNRIGQVQHWLPTRQTSAAINELTLRTVIAV